MVCLCVLFTGDLPCPDDRLVSVSEMIIMASMACATCETKGV